MSIRLHIPPEPYTEASWRGETIVIESAASRQLESELRRYCLREVDGRSFLIAGHRGAGKTTLVHHVVQKLVRESLAKNGMRRPLIVRLHGPNLLRRKATPDEANDKVAGTTAGKVKDASEAIAAAVDPSSASSPGERRLAAATFMARRDRERDRESDPHMQQVQTALHQITLSLYRALASEVTACYRDRVDHHGIPAARRADLLERAAQLELELDQFPTPDRLRGFWAAAGALQSGVLFPRSAQEFHALDQPMHGNVRDQGLRELVALASACHAYGRISGTFEKAELKQSINAATKSEVGIEQAGQNIISPLASIFTGGLAGAAIYTAPAQGQPFVATFSGILAALGAAAVFKYSASRSRERTASSDFTFLPDLSVATLDRALPVLVNRITAAGLVPVFVIDELDKVESLYDELEGVIRHVKNIVAERAFFCFLTDRSYYERVVSVSINDPYPKHYTYFTDRVFVSFQAPDMHRYLRSVLRVEPVAEPRQQPRAGDPHAGLPPASASTDQDDLEVLPYVLLRRAGMHAIELRRQLAWLRGPQDLLRLAPGEVRFKRPFLFDLLYQFCVELVLGRPRLLDRLRDDPAFSRLAHDALYYPLRRLHDVPFVPEEPVELDLSDAGRDTFCDYLVERMSSDRESEEAEGEGIGTQTPDGNRKVPPLRVHDTDPDLLFEDVRHFVSLLIDPWALLDELDAGGRRAAYPRAVLEALPLNPENGPLLEPVADVPHRYRWRYDRDWNPRDESGRSHLAHQLDLYIDLGIRLAMRETSLPPGVEHTPELDRQLRSALLQPAQAWHRDERSLDVAEHALPDLFARVAPFLDPPLYDPWRAMLLRLGELLSDTADYFSAVNRSGLRERYGPGLAALVPQKPLLRRAGDTWTFRYDARGRPLDNEPVQDIWSAAAADWERDIDFVRSVASALAELNTDTGSKRSGDAADLSALADLGVLASSPPWSAAEPALRRLEAYRASHRSYPQFQDDVRGIADYARMLLTNRHTLCAAVLVGGTIARAIPREGTDVVAGLRIIMDTYRFEAEGEESIAATLERLQSTLLDEHPGLTPAAGAIPADAFDADAWLHWARTVTRALRTVVHGDMAGKRESAWSEWRAHLEGTAARADARFVPSIAGLLCRAARIGPHLVLRDEVQQMTAADWSDALLRSQLAAPADDPAGTPPWLAVHAARALHLQDTPAAAGRIALIVRAPSSITTAWRPGERTGFASWTREQTLHALSEGDRAPMLTNLLSRLNAIFVEHDSATELDGIAGEIIGHLTRSAGGRRPNVVLFGAARSLPHPAWAARVVGAPRGPEDLFGVIEPVAVTGERQLPPVLHRLWTAGGALAGEVLETARGPRRTPLRGGAHATFELYLKPHGQAADATLVSVRRSIAATLSFGPDGLLRAGRFLRRRYRVTAEGTVMRFERVAVELGSLPLPPQLLPVDILEIADDPDTGGITFDRRFAILTRHFRFRGTLRPRDPGSKTM